METLLGLLKEWAELVNDGVMQFYIHTSWVLEWTCRCAQEQTKELLAISDKSKMMELVEDMRMACFESYVELDLYFQK